MDFAHIGGGLNAIGASLRGDDGMALVERAKRKDAIEGLMDRMGIAGPKRDILASMPVDAATEALWGVANPAPAENVVINGQLVNRQTGQVVGNYNPAPIDIDGLFGNPTTQYVREGLIARGVPSHVADGIIVNMNDESGMNPAINERNPTVPGSRGGFGLAQWTGPRRKQLEAFAAQRGKPVSDIDTQMDFLVWEMNNTESEAGAKILNAETASEAAQATVNDFLRPAPQHRDARAAKYAKIDAQIDKATKVLMSGQGTDKQREGVKQFIKNLEAQKEALAGPETPTSIQALEYRARAAGLTPGTPEYSQFMLEGGRTGGLLVETGPDGQIRVAQGSAASNPKFNEVESKTNIYYTRAKGALEVLEPRAGELTNPVARGVEGDPTGVLRGVVQSDEFQIAKNAGDEFLQAILRKDTGAAITEMEQYLYGRTYLPQPGDSEAVLKTKSEARKRALSALESGMSAAQMLAAERALGETPEATPAEVQPLTFETFSKQALSDSDVQAAINEGLTLEEIWKYHPDNPEAQ